MKKFNPSYLACQLIAAGVVSVCCQSAQAQLLFSDSFNYTPGSTLGGNINLGNSVAWSGGNAVLAIGGTQLTYAGLQENSATIWFTLPARAQAPVTIPTAR